MAAKRRVAKAGAGAYAAGRAARTNPYVQRLIDDDELRENLRTAFDSARKAYARMNGKGPAKLMDDKKAQKELREAATSLRDAADSLRGAKAKKRRRRGRRMLLLAVVGGALAIALSGDLRKKVLDALFGAEEEFEYTSTTSPQPATGEPVGTA